MTNCCQCQQPISDPRTAYPEITGFARPRSLRGENSGSSIVGRTATGRWLCSGCAVKLVHGVSQGQERLV